MDPSARVLRVLPEVFAEARLLSEEADRGTLPALGRLHPALGQRAVCAWAGGRAALSHLSALHVWGLHRQRAGAVLHLSAPDCTAAGHRTGAAETRSGPGRNDQSSPDR